MADYCTQFVVNSPFLQDGFSYQTGVGGSIASTISLAKIMKERNIRMHVFGVGGLAKPMCDLLINNQVDCLDTQDFDLAASRVCKELKKHFRISAGEYADHLTRVLL